MTDYTSVIVLDFTFRHINSKQCLCHEVQSPEREVPKLFLDLSPCLPYNIPSALPKHFFFLCSFSCDTTCHFLPTWCPSHDLPSVRKGHTVTVALWELLAYEGTQVCQESFQVLEALLQLRRKFVKFIKAAGQLL